MKLNIKLTKQQKGYCGPTSVKMVMDYKGIKRSQEQWADILGATKKSGCTPEQIINGLKKLNFQVIYKKNSSLEELKNLIKNKTPPIIYWEPVKKYGHYSVLAGINSKNIFIANPRKPIITKMSTLEFLEKWHDEFGKKGDKREILIVENPKIKYRPAVFIVVYRINQETKEPEYILLKRKLHWKGWEFPKGGIDKNENSIQTAKRETKEETGLSPIKIMRYNINGKYVYPKLLKDRPHFKGQTYELFSASVKQKSNQKIKLDPKEHSAYVWLPFKQAIKKLTWSDQKKCLKIVNRSLVK
jgi:8-oxo-dGTP pyrophosphatase MutT (NUDIX family)/predicted double-glycine peptidase